ncbi:MAG: DEAD/DEAH box helicase family protein [Anaerolineae bacterium]|nr:DEAD/DEAH box helicase family protein [Anaerolineae bacterium]
MISLRDHDFQLSYGPGDDRLHAFYIPALKASLHYDRMTGFFSSKALAIAAAGVAHLVVNRGRMRLLVGAQLSREDVAAIQQGHALHAIVEKNLERALPDPVTLLDTHLRDRLAALAWLIAHDALEIRVVLPKGHGGVPLPAPESREYFHPKVGIFTDAGGDQVAFNGSINESENAWEHNYEYFTVWRSWVSDESRAYVAEQVGRFERLWSHREPDWLALPIPEAVRQRLLRYMPDRAPLRDPLEAPPVQAREPATLVILTSQLEKERILAQFLRDAPYLVGGAGLGAATAAVVPWPHQQTVARRVVETFPDRYVFCDEVGLGKTIEAGLVLRSLWLNGIVRRALILTPKSVLHQWQEELYEKFVLDVPVYDGRALVYLDKTSRPSTSPNPWNALSLVLASSQLVKRKDRWALLLEAEPWDLVLVDESHHARRKDFLNKRTYRPNRLLELLTQLQSRTKGLLLMTATPMQVDPIEVWDLLSLLGLSGEWGADGRNFLRFYHELRRDEPDWEFVVRMFRAELAAGNGNLDSAWMDEATRVLGPVETTKLRCLLDGTSPAREFKALSPSALREALALLKRHTPLRRLVFRNTRPLLRRYVEEGLLKENVPHRRPELVWIEMSAEEKALYDRIEEYISNFYRKYEAQRKGLGFVMTVYRRRLTSSFYAVRCSLERRLEFLRGRASLEFTEDDLEQEVLASDVDEAFRDMEAGGYQDEIDYVEDFLHALRVLGTYDSKVEQLLDDLRALFHERDTVLIFTQYTDTMDYLRDQLRQRYGGQVACYSGRGGEWWDGNAWVPVSKEMLKNAFREGQKIKILLATEAASEGLNLQTCGVLINYDMPWNPMRVEQRIGRIDRIGQVYDTVWIKNYFYQDTVEAKVYQALNTRIDWFQDVVGPLQPILAQVSRVIQAIAMSQDVERRQVLEEAVASLGVELDAVASQLNIDEWADHAGDGRPWTTPVSLEQLGSIIQNFPTLADRFTPHAGISGAFFIQLDGERRVCTFDRNVFDAHPNSVQLLTYGHPWLSRLLEEIPAPAGDQAFGSALRVEVASPLRRVAYYRIATEVTDAGDIARIDTLGWFQAALQTAVEWPPEQRSRARRDVERAVQDEWDQMGRRMAALVRAQLETLYARAARLLLDAALVELALGQQPDLLGEGEYPLAFDEHAVSGLKRHGPPWSGLLKLTWSKMPFRRPRPTDPFFIEIQGHPPDLLRRQFSRFENQARHLIREILALQQR